MFRMRSVLVSAGLIACVACGGGNKEPKTPANPSGKKDSKGRAVSKEAAQNFTRALDEFASHDRKQDWSGSTCNSVASAFNDASKEQKSATNRELPEALYNAGLAYQRCGSDAKAREQFNAALKADPKFHRAKAQLALYEFQKNKNLSATISKLQAIVREAKFQNAEALVSMAALQMERNGDSADSDGKNDLERAQRNLQRALAIDDSFMPAFNQLAIYYMEQAKAAAQAAEGKKKRRRRALVAASAKRRDVNSQQLDLAALVASQAIRKNPNYAPIHNTAGLIQVQLKNFNGAVKSFSKARRLDPGFFEAHMNYAAVNLSFRGFVEAEKAYRAALKLRPKTYEARLGLALAIRGQIRPGDPGKLTPKAQAELNQAKKIDGARPETYYNEAILTQEFKAKGSEKAAIPMLKKAAGLYRQFISKAGGDPAFAEAVKRAKERSQDIEDTVKFIEEGQKAKK